MVQAAFTVGYSSHGNFDSIQNILELEQERCNETVDDIIKFIEDNNLTGSESAIWIMYDIDECYKKYVYPYLSDNDKLKADRDIGDYITAIDLTKLKLVTTDYCGGYLYVKRRTNKRR